MYLRSRNSIREDLLCGSQKKPIMLCQKEDIIYHPGQKEYITEVIFSNMTTNLLQRMLQKTKKESDRIFLQSCGVGCEGKQELVLTRPVYNDM